jgi:hydrogenase maturation factor
VLALKKHFQLTDEQVLALSSTGTILAAVTPQAKEKVEAALRQNSLSACFIGEFTENKNRILVKGEKEQAFPSVADDPYTRLLATKD